MSSSGEGRVALIVGGTRGLGRGLALALYEDGWTVVVCGRTPPGDSLSDDISFVRCDVRKIDEVEALVAEVNHRHGRLDLLLNNAGGSPVVSAATASPRLSQSIIDLNLTGPLHLSRAAYPIMYGQPEGGSIINIASISAQRPAPGTAAYSAAKAGLVSLTSALALEWGPTIRVNAIVLGLLASDAAALDHYGGEAGMARIIDSVPMKRLANSDDVAGLVRFLVSPAAAFITGAQIAVHGGGEVPSFIYLAQGS